MSYRRLDKYRLPIIGSCCAVALTMTAATIASDVHLAEQVRQPTAILPIHDTHIAVLNQRAGSVSTIDRDTLRVMHEQVVGERLAGGCVLANGDLAIVDASSDELLRVTVSADQIRLVDRLAVPTTPVNVVATNGGSQCVVASTWARQLAIISASPTGQLEHMQTVDLEFAPRQMLAINDQQLLVGDAFGGWMAVVDLESGSVIRQRELQATHNISGIALNKQGTQAFVTHQILYDQSTTKPNVHWGDVMSNVVRRLDLSWFLSPDPEETTAADLYYLGYPDQAAGDPQGISITASKRFIVGLSGVNQIAISDQGLNHFQRIDVGRRPAGFWLDDHRHKLFVANQFDDTISVIDVQRRRTVATISIGPTGPLDLASKGEQLFYDARLSSDGWYSCHSCHTDGHTNGRRSDTLGDGYHGDPKQVLSLLGVAETGPWAWNGKSPMLEQQIRKSIETTMRGDPPRNDEVQALAAYLMSLRSPPSLATSRGQDNSASVDRGQAVFDEHGCADCHQPPTYTSSDVYDVSLDDAEGQRYFNPPSLLGVGHRSRLLHNGRASTMTEALKSHRNNQSLELNQRDLDDLQAFLGSL